MSKTRLLVVGSGGHGHFMAEAAALSGQFDLDRVVTHSMSLPQRLFYYFRKIFLLVNLRTCRGRMGRNDLIFAKYGENKI